MAYQAIVLPVMIASPGDVADERDVIRHVIHDWNDVNGAASKTMLAPVGWETHSSPELGSRPQALINDRLLQDCDLLIGVFWTRLGTPTGESESGTVEEIREHINAGKPAMIYFSSKPVSPQSIDSEQYAAVRNFEAECRALGLVESFDNTADFEKTFHKQLQISLTNNEYLRNLISGQEIRTAHADERNAQVEVSEDAKTLLKAATSDKSGNILKLVYIGGKHIQAGGQTFGGEVGRESAKWEAALSELVQKELVLALGDKDQVFELTHAGWVLSDSL